MDSACQQGFVKAFDVCGNKHSTVSSTFYALSNMFLCHSCTRKTIFSSKRIMLPPYMISTLFDILYKMFEKFLDLIPIEYDVIMLGHLQFLLHVM